MCRVFFVSSVQADEAQHIFRLLRGTYNAYMRFHRATCMHTLHNYKSKRWKNYVLLVFRNITAVFSPASLTTLFLHKIRRLNLFLLRFEHVLT